MRKLKSLWRRAFDVRKGEYLRTLSMSLYLLFVLFAYYILKPVSRALFLNQFDIDKLPFLYILIAAAGGVLAYFYTKLALRTSLATAVTWAMGLAVACLVAMWWLIGLNLNWMLYVFNVWVSLFSIVLVSQGWLVAANVFDAREAKRLYGLLGLGAVIGAAFGGTFTAYTVQIVGTHNLMLISAVMVILAYGAFRLTVYSKGVSLQAARAAEAEEAEFRFHDILSAIGRHRHLQVIIAIITLTYIVDVLVEFQFSWMAKRTYQGDELTAFFGSFYGIYLNLITFVLQFFLTAAVVNRMGVGGTLQIMPVAISLGSLATAFAPNVWSTGSVRLTEAATRYTFNRTGMELLYLPLPGDLKNRTKAFVDIFVDRMGRGLGGILLALVTWRLDPSPRHIAWLVIGFCAAWMILSQRAKKEYVSTVRKRLANQRLDLSSARLNVGDPATIALLEETIARGAPRQVSYALSLLADAPGYPLEPQLRKLVSSPSTEVRSKVYDLARQRSSPDLLEQAQADVQAGASRDGATKAAVGYLLALSPDPARLAAGLLEHPDCEVVEGALEAAGAQNGPLSEVVSYEWISRASQDSDPRRRRLAAIALGVTGDQGTEALHHLLEDPDPMVAAAASTAAGQLKNRAYVFALCRHLAHPRLRGAAIDALAAYGARIVGTLGDILGDESLPVAVRRHVPRVLSRIPEQRSVDTLLASIAHPELLVRGAVLKALNRLREEAPGLRYGEESVSTQILNEARYYFELMAALEPFRETRGRRRSAAALLASSIEERLKQTLERMFRLLGLRYPPKEMYAAYLAVNLRRAEQYSAALEFLDNVLDRQLKRVLMPLLDASGSAVERGHDLFGIRQKDAEDAIRELIRSGDPWLVACAMAAAAELKIRRLAPDIQAAARGAGAEVAEVGRAAGEALGSFGDRLHNPQTGESGVM